MLGACSAHKASPARAPARDDCARVPSPNRALRALRGGTESEKKMKEGKPSLTAVWGALGGGVSRETRAANLDDPTPRPRLPPAAPSLISPPPPPPSVLTHV